MAELGVGSGAAPHLAAFTTSAAIRMRRQWPRGVYSEGSGSGAADEPSEGGIGSYYMAEAFIHDDRLWSMRLSIPSALPASAQMACVRTGGLLRRRWSFCTRIHGWRGASWICIHQTEAIKAARSSDKERTRSDAS